MLGTIVNTIAIIVGGLLGLCVRGGLPEKYAKTTIHAISLAVILVGLKGALKTDALMVVIFSLALGSVLGEWLGIEDRLESLGKWIESRFAHGDGSLTNGFVSASLIYCVGAMAIVGALESGLSGNHQTLFAKSVLDGISAVIFAATFGVGVLFSAGSVLVYQGTITAGAELLQPLLVPAVVAQMSSVGGLLIVAIGLNLLEVQKIRVGNMLPAIFCPLIWFLVKQLPPFGG